VRVAIIGAGPAGWAAASILKSVKGAEVSVFHGGVKDGTGIRDKSSKKTGSIKLLRGSDFPYRDFPFGPKTHEDGVHIPKSFSKAGLSLVWGATMLPYAQSDIQHWPISTRDLEYGYKFVSERMPISGREDRLATTFMPYFSQPPLQPTNRILRLLEIADSRPESDITIGSSRLAIFNTTRKEQGCNYCDLCLQGCPTEKIWSAPSIVSSNIHYLENFRIVGIKEIENKVILSAIDDTGESHEFGGFDKIFLAAGNVESFRILATSGCVDNKVVLKDSATFYIPLLISLKYRRVDKSKYSLSQAFMRIKTSNQKACQLQIYDFSEDLVHRASKASAFGKIVPFVFFRILLKRMFVSIGFIFNL
jgi:ferredoxin